MDKGADVNAKKSDGITILMIASANDHTDVVKLLLDKGADVNAKNNDRYNCPDDGIGGMAMLRLSNSFWIRALM